MMPSVQITLKSVWKTFTGLFKPLVRKRVAETTNPWEADLARLAAERREEAPLPTQSEHTDEISQFVNDLAKAASKDKNAPAQQPVKSKRSSDPTVTDLKAWWGESVATWSPENDKNNVTSSDQRNRHRQATWLNKGPSTFDK